MDLQTLWGKYISYENNVHTSGGIDIYATKLTIQLFENFYEKFLHNFAEPEEKNVKTWQSIYENQVKLATSPLPRVDVRLEYNENIRMFRLMCMVTAPTSLHITVDCDDTRSEFRSVCTGGKKYWHACALLDYADDTANKNVEVQFSLQFCVPDTEGELSEDIEHLFNTKKFTDAVVISSDKEEFKVHRNILAARSAVFSAMYTHDTAEARTGRADSPFEADVLREVLTFIYSGKSPRLYELASQLLPAASYYQLKILKSMCVVALEYSLNIDNSLDTLTLADEQDVDRLKNVVLKFINEHAKAVIKQTGWKNLRSNLVRELFECSISESCSEDEEEE